MDPALFTHIDPTTWRVEPTGRMRVPAIIYADDGAPRHPGYRGQASVLAALFPRPQPHRTGLRQTDSPLDALSGAMDWSTVKQL
jgi:hypothetical protein